MHVSWIPLKQELRDKFDEKAAQDFFYETDGLPYGYHNFIYGWINTAEDNWPPLLAKQLVPAAIKIMEGIAPQQAETMFTQGLNMRLGTVGTNISEIAYIAAS